MNGSTPLLVGAVLYDPKVSVVWDIITEFFWAQGCPVDCVYYTTYELQVRALIEGHIHIAWNSPLAWIDAQRQTGHKCRAIAMRDTDRDRVTHVLVRLDAGLQKLADLRGKTIATGAKDSPQATLLPLHLLFQNGLVPGRDVTVQRFDVLAGKHGDHVGGEREALGSLMRGESDAAAVLDLNWQAWQADGTVDPKEIVVLATTAPFDHCNFSVLASLSEEEIQRWTTVLFQMRYDEPSHRQMMDMEGLKAWLPGRVDGYEPLEAATRDLGYFDETFA
jgi:ABC-type phosphate/phosphonate transport system substrate-binding protein